MKSFRIFLESADIVSFIQQMKSYVLASIKVTDGFISVRFPSSAPVLQVAHTVHEGIEKEDPHGKAGLAYRVIAPDVQWGQNDVMKFKKDFQKNLQLVSKEMGLLFEIETFLYLTDTRNLSPVGEKETFWAYGRKEELENITISKVGKELTKRIIDMLAIHARDMGEKLYQRAKQVANCQQMEVEFLGGEGRVTTDRADLRVGCISYSLKFTSEAKVHVASFTHERTYKLLGGEDVDAFKDNLQRLQNGYKALKSYAVEEYGGLAQSYNGDPKKFVDLLNFLISGGGKVMPAITLYIRRKGTPGFSKALLMDFASKDGFRLSPKPGADVKVSSTGSYVKITYKVPGGTSFGTFVQFEPQMEGVNVKMNNLASVGGRNY